MSGTGKGKGKGKGKDKDEDESKDAVHHPDRLAEVPGGAMPPFVPCRVTSGAQVHVATNDGRMYQVQRTLKKTIYGRVKSALVCRQHTDGLFYATEERVVLKVSSKSKVTRARQEATAALKPLKEDPVRELKMSAYTNRQGHPNVLPLIGVVHDAAMMASIFPFVDGGDCMDFMEAGTVRSEAEVKHLFRDLLQGLAYLHYIKGIAHRDISFENVMIREPPRAGAGGAGAGAAAGRASAMIIDLGGAAELPVNDGDAARGVPPHFGLFRGGAVGKLGTMAPEVFSGSTFYGHLADVWSAGVVLFGILTGYPLLERPSRSLDPHRYPLVADGRLAELIRTYGVVDRVPPGALEVLSMIFQEDPLKRPTALDLLRCRWLGGDGYRMDNPVRLPTVRELEGAGVDPASGEPRAAPAAADDVALALVGPEEDDDMDVDEDSAGAGAGATPDGDGDGDGAGAGAPDAGRDVSTVSGASAASSAAPEEDVASDSDMDMDIG